jgi:MtN3 and saliva related transmembrane protein
MNGIEIIGHIGAFLTAITFMPQVYKAWKTRSVGDLSLTMMLIVVFSTIVWLIYAVALHLWPVILANAVIGILSCVLIYFKFAFKR